MEREKLDKWAAEFMGETGADVSDAVAASWYTTSPGAAFVVLNKCASEGKRVELEIEDGEVSVECGDAEEEGDVENLAELIIKVCYACNNG